MHNQQTADEEASRARTADEDMKNLSQQPSRSVKSTRISDLVGDSSRKHNPAKHALRPLATSASDSAEGDRRQNAERDDTSQAGNYEPSEAPIGERKQTSSNSSTATSVATGPLDGAKKRKGLISPRVGQACDRCKKRKIRCDGLPDGCWACMKSNVDCKTTDLNSGRSIPRGHTKQIEDENTALRHYVLELQQQLREMSVEPKAAPDDLSIG